MRRTLLAVALLTIAGCGSDRFKPGTVVTLDSSSLHGKEGLRYDGVEFLITPKNEPVFDLTRESRLEVIADDGPPLGKRKEKNIRLVKLRVLDGPNVGKTGEWYSNCVKPVPPSK